MLHRVRTPHAYRPLSFIAYLNDPVAVHGATTLFRQKVAIERYVTFACGEVEQWVIDSGQRFAGQVYGDALVRLIGELRPGDKLVIARLDILARNEQGVGVVAAAVKALGAHLLCAEVLELALSQPRRAARDPLPSSNVELLL